MINLIAEMFERRLQWSSLMLIRDAQMYASSAHVLLCCELEADFSISSSTAC